MADETEPERRAESRRPIELKVEYKRLNTFFADYTKNISRGGTFIKTSRPLPVGTEFLFKLFVPKRELPLTIHGEVQRIIEEAPGEDAGMAIRFVYREGDPQAEISRIVEGMMTESLGPRLYAKLMESTTTPSPTPTPTPTPTPNGGSPASGATSMTAGTGPTTRKA